MSWSSSLLLRITGKRSKALASARTTAGLYFLQSRGAAADVCWAAMEPSTTTHGTRFTILDAGRATVVDATIRGGRVLVSEGGVAALGWTLEARGLCRGSECVVVPAASALRDAAGIDLAELARLLDRPLAMDVEERAAALGASARTRAQALASLEAPDFSLPDLAGRRHSLREHRGKKVLLVVYASW
jgi:hypothetical protein